MHNNWLTGLKILQLAFSSRTANTEFFLPFFFFLELHPWHMEVSGLGLGVELELQLPAYTTATAMPDPTCVCDLHPSSWQCRILTPLSEARNGTRILMDTSQVRYR